MSIRLNSWQTVLIFLPCVIGAVIIGFSHYGSANYTFHFAMANFLSVINVTLAILYQAYLAISFEKASGMKLRIFKWNALIPAVFISIYLLYVIWSTFVNPAYHNPHYNAGPIRKSQLHGSSLIILIFLFHAFATFYFVNNQYVSKKINLITDESERGKLYASFMIPMRRLTKISIWVIGSLLLFNLIVDILTLKVIN